MDSRRPQGKDPAQTPDRPGTLGRNPTGDRAPEGQLPKDFQTKAPAVSVPKGGGAIKSIGEKFSANPVTGSAGFSLPLPASPGRGGFGPQLALSYDSGVGNGPFGLGWRLNLASVRRKTDKGLPRYRDEGKDADTFVLSDAEDLVPLKTYNSGTGTWSVSVRQHPPGVNTWTVERYRPRVESAFALIERWTKNSDSTRYWRTISRDNVKRSYGKTAQAQVTDPDDSSRVFEWLLEEEIDEHGNVISYQYSAEDRAGLSAHPAEARRGSAGNGVTWRYLSRVSYGNTVMSSNPDAGGSGAFRFHLVFDYGDHSTTDPGASPTQTWAQRDDVFSNFRAGFDMRCYRLCQRVLMMHSFASVRVDGSSNPVPVVVRSLELSYEARNTVSTLSSAQLKGWRWDGSTYDTDTMPPCSFTYSQPEIDESVVLVEGLEDIPNGLDMRAWRFVDLDGEGLSGLLTQQGDSWFYKRNEGDGRFAAARSLGQRPNLPLGGAQLVDLDGDGSLDMVVMRPGLSGHFAYEDSAWSPFQSFVRAPSVRSDDPNVRLIDLDGDGHADLMVTDHEVFTWWPSEAKDGFGEPNRVAMATDENEGPRLIFARDRESIFLADMTGDGLSDIVRILNGNICYWPNKGYGRFGAKVQMKCAPRFDHPDRFDPSRIRLADIDGSGPTDLIYLGPDAVKIWFNESGNGFSETATQLTHFPALARPNDVQVADLRGDGTACLVWSSPLLSEGSRPLRYVHLMAQGKPWLLSTITNGLGRETRLTYTASTAFYLSDRREGSPWATRLPFPVYCVTKVESLDHVTGWRFVTEYAFHHGYFDGEEREFRGFGLVEQWDTETLSDFETGGDPDLVVQVDPVLTRTWFHTGAWRKEQTLLDAYEAEYDTHDTDAHHLSWPAMPSNLSPGDLREAHRALKGRMVRQEVFSQNSSGTLTRLYTASEQTFMVSLLQPGGSNTCASFRVDPSETLSYAYDMDLTATTPTADPRVTHSLVLAVDSYGNTTRSGSIAYPRRDSGADSEQTTLRVLVTELQIINQDNRIVPDDIWHIGVFVRSKTFDLTSTTAWTDDSSPATVSSLNSQFNSATLWSFEQTPTGTGPHKRLIAHHATQYWNDTVTAPMVFGILGKRALPHTSFVLAFTSGLVTQLFGSSITGSMLTQAGYGNIDADGNGSPDGHYWIPSGRLVFDSTKFYVPTSHVDPFGKTTTMTWDSDSLAITQVQDPANMTVTATIDYQLLQADTVTDPNGTETELTFDALGRVLTQALRNGSEGDGSSAYSMEFVYYQNSWHADQTPACVHALALKEYGGSDWQESWTYSDGGGNLVQTKVQAANGLAPDRDSNGDLLFVSGVLQWATTTAGRWIGTGRTIVDNKGNVVKQYEPFFSSSSDYEDEAELVEWGVSPVLSYDPLGRNTQVELPDGNLRSWSYSPWQVSASDENDNESGGDHEGTPTTTDLDNLGRPYRVTVTPDGTTTHETTLTLDIQGNVLTVNDPRGNDIQVQEFDMLGRPAFTGSADEGYTLTSGKGETLTLLDIHGQPLRSFKSGSLSLRREYDNLRRPTRLYADTGSGERLVELTIYGDKLTGVPSTDYAKGKPYHVYDTAGRTTFTYDFRGLTATQTRTFFDDITTEANWTGLETQASLTLVESWVSTYGTLESDTYPIENEYDALGRLSSQLTPDDSELVPGYDAGGRLTTLEVFVQGATSATDFVTEITYNARGQRESITYANNTSTTYTYDANRFRLTNLETSRTSACPDGAATLQDLSFTYDPVGNITEIADAAQESVFFANTQVDATRTFTYDALYRLSQATGREKLSSSQTSAFYLTYASSMGGLRTDTTTVLGNYTETYTYDKAGNITEMKHQEGSGGTVLWRRGYAYASGNNQLQSSSLPGDDPDVPSTHSCDYTYNNRGALVFMPHLSTSSSTNLTRDFRDQLRKADLPTSGEVCWYAYDAAGQRVRKYWDKSGAEERLYIGPFEVWRQYNGSGTVVERRETLHIMDDQRRIAMIETLTVTAGSGSTSPKYRYQLTDHLGTACLEVDEQGSMITYEEYHPYGSTAWWAEKSTMEVSRKRYRFTGMENDEETGMCMHGLRYYLPWLGSWDRPDPIGLGDGANRFGYCHGNPCNKVDRRGTDTGIPEDDPAPAPSLYFDQPDPALGEGATPEQVREYVKGMGFGYPEDVVPTYENGRWNVGKNVWRLDGEQAGVVPSPVSASNPTSDRASAPEAAGAFAAGVAVGVAVGYAAGYLLGAAFALSNPVGWVLLGVMVIGGAAAIWSQRNELKASAGRLLSNEGTAEDWFTLGTFVAPSAVGRGAKVGGRHAVRAAAAVRNAIAYRTATKEAARAAGHTDIKGIVTNLSGPEKVDPLKSAMKEGTFVYTSPEGRIAYMVAEDGSVVLQEGHHRMTAALELAMETGDYSYVVQLIRNGINYGPLPAGELVRPMPIR